MEIIAEIHMVFSSKKFLQHTSVLIFREKEVEAVVFLFSTCKEGGRRNNSQVSSTSFSFGVKQETTNIVHHSDVYNLNITETTTEQRFPTYNIKLQ